MMTLKAAKQACLAMSLGAVSASAEPTHPPAEGLPAIAVELRELARTRPRQVHDAVLNALRDCLPEDAQPSLSTPAVNDLIVGLHLLYFDLVGQKSAGPSVRQKLAIVINESSRSLSSNERKDLEVLRLQGLEQGLTLLCVAGTARGLLASTQMPHVSR
nr:hypothetical protein RKHAN_00254 [Rhizobium sp. Khangiran2]